MSEWLTNVWRRLIQGLNALLPAKISADRDVVLASNLTDLQASAFRSLPTYDQAHLLSVHTRLVVAGSRDPDLLAAALLHDIGKVDQHGTVRLPDRVARVLLRKFAPTLLTRLVASSRPGVFHGLHLCVHHPRLGAERAAALGSSARTVWLISQHESNNITSEGDLAQLQAADNQ